MPGYDGPSIFNKRLIPSDRFEETADKQTNERKKSASKEKKNYQRNEKSSLFQHAKGEARKNSHAVFSDSSRMNPRSARENSVHFTRSSTPFQVRKVPSPYYGLNPRPQKKEEVIDYSLLKKRLKKEEADFLLFEGYIKDDIAQQFKTNNASEKEEIQNSQYFETSAKNGHTKTLKKRNGLSKSLSGIIEEEQHAIATKNQRMTNLFSVHILD